MRNLQPLLFVTILMLSACGGGGGSTGNSSPPTSGPPPAPPTTEDLGNVLVEIGTPDGYKPDLWVRIYGSSYMRSATTDASGQVRFTVPVGDAVLVAGGPGYASGFASIKVNGLQRVATRVDLRKIDTRAVPVFAVRNVSLQRSRLGFDVEFAVLTEQGESIETLTAADVDLYIPECTINDNCVADADGKQIGLGYGIGSLPSDFTFVPARPRSPFAAALLFEHSALTDDFDPTRLRYSAARTFIDSITTDDRVALGRYQRVGTAAEMSVYGGFVADGTELHPALQGLMDSDTDFTLNMDAAAAVNEMLTFMTTGVPTSKAAANPAVVVVAPSAPSPNCSLFGCASLVTAVSQARRDRIPVFAVGSDLTNPSLVQLAMSSGGSFIDVAAPDQYETVARALGSLLGGGMPHYRLHIELTGLSSGQVALVYLTLKQPERLDMYIPVPIP